MVPFMEDGVKYPYKGERTKNSDDDYWSCDE